MHNIILHRQFNPHYLLKGGEYDITMLPRRRYCADDDIQNIFEWIIGETKVRKKPSTLMCRYQVLSINTPKILKQIYEMKFSYDEFPDDYKRAEKIKIQMLNTGNLFCIFIKNNDPALFIMEGRHRITAYLDLNIKYIPVFFVL